MHFIQRKQFSETNVTSHAYQQISDFKIFLNAQLFTHCLPLSSDLCWCLLCMYNKFFMSWAVLYFDLCFFPECFADYWKRCGGPHVSRGPVVGLHYSSLTAWEVMELQRLAQYGKIMPLKDCLAAKVLRNS